MAGTARFAVAVKHCACACLSWRLLDHNVGSVAAVGIYEDFSADLEDFSADLGGQDGTKRYVADLVALNATKRAC